LVPWFAMDGTYPAWLANPNAMARQAVAITHRFVQNRKPMVHAVCHATNLA
jgi:hypothetical protein